jgi:hypothetical protein
MVATTINYINLLAGLLSAKAMNEVQSRMYASRTQLILCDHSEVHGQTGMVGDTHVWGCLLLPTCACISPPLKVVYCSKNGIC